MTAPIVIAKLCRRCGQTKPLGEYHRNRNTRDGRQSQCKTCMCDQMAIWRQSQSAEEKELARKRERKREAAYTQARRQLIDTHREEFDALYRRALDEQGLT